MDVPLWLYGVWSVWGVIILGSVWSMICSYRTLRQRSRILDNRPQTRLVATNEWGDAEYAEFMGQHYGPWWRDYDQVSFGAHSSALFFLRSPKSLYGPAVQECWDRPWQPAKTVAPVVEDTRAYLAAITGES